MSELWWWRGAGFAGGFVFFSGILGGEPGRALVGAAFLLALGAAAVLLRAGCPHEHVRCTHGDEIIARNFHRQVCLDCGRSLDRPLPEMCWTTGRPH